MGDAHSIDSASDPVNIFRDGDALSTTVVRYFVRPENSSVNGGLIVLWDLLHTFYLQHDSSHVATKEIPCSEVTFPSTHSPFLSSFVQIQFLSLGIQRPPCHSMGMTWSAEDQRGGTGMPCDRSHTGPLPNPGSSGSFWRSVGEERL